MQVVTQVAGGDTGSRWWHGFQGAGAALRRRVATCGVDVVHCISMTAQREMSRKPHQAKRHYSNP